MFDDPAAADEFLLVPVVLSDGCFRAVRRAGYVSILVVRSLVQPEIAICIDSGRSLYLSATYSIVP
jgi:hypothetical protein